MNQKQAIALALGLLAGTVIAVFAKPPPTLRPVSVKTQATGEIVTTYQHPTPVWPLVALGTLIVLTGLAVYGLRGRGQGGPQ